MTIIAAKRMMKMMKMIIIIAMTNRDKERVGEGGREGTERCRGIEDESMRHPPLLALVKSRHLLIVIDMNDDIDVKLNKTKANESKSKHHHNLHSAKYVTTR